MANPMTMADLLAKQDSKIQSVSRNQDLEGTVITILSQDIILDLGRKAEGVLSKRELSSSVLENLKVGDKITASVLQTENESGQVVLGYQKAVIKKGYGYQGGGGNSNRFKRFEDAKKGSSTVRGRATEINKGGLIVEVDGFRGFLPSSQVTLSQAAKLEELVGKEIDVTVLEVDANQNRLIFSQKTNVSEDTKKKLSSIKIGDKVEGKVAAILPFGVFITLPDNVEGLVHISEIAWEKVEDPGTIFKVGDAVSATVISIEPNTGRVNLSIKQLEKDPFLDKIKDLKPEDVVKAKVSKVSSQGVYVTLDGGIEGVIPSSKMEPGVEYPIGKEVTLTVDNIDSGKRRINLVPFITSTSGLIYK